MIGYYWYSYDLERYVCMVFSGHKLICYRYAKTIEQLKRIIVYHHGFDAELVYMGIEE